MSYSTGHKPHFDLCSTFEVVASGESVFEQHVSEHKGWELNFLPSGARVSSYMKLRNKEWEIRRGRVLLFNGEENHTEIFGDSPSEQHQVGAVVFYPDFLEKLLRPFGIDAQELVFENVELDASPRARGLLRALMEFRASPGVSSFSYDCLATDFVFELLSSQRHTQSTKLKPLLSSGHYPGPVNRAKSYIAERALEPSLSIGDVATHSGLSTFHFIRTFRNRTGITPRDYLNGLRIDLAKNALLKGSSVTDAALASGFSSLSTFNKAFKRHTGCAPSALLG